MALRWGWYVAALSVVLTGCFGTTGGTSVEETTKSDVAGDAGWEKHAKPLIVLRQVVQGNSLLARGISPQFAAGIEGPDAVIYENGMAIIASPITAVEDAARAWTLVRLSPEEIARLQAALEPAFEGVKGSLRIGEPIDARAMRLEIMRRVGKGCVKIDANGRFLGEGERIGPYESRRDVIPSKINAAAQALLALDGKEGTPWMPTHLKVHLAPASALAVDAIEFLEQAPPKRELVDWPASWPNPDQLEQWPGATHATIVPLGSGDELESFGRVWDSLGGKDIKHAKGPFAALAYEASLPGEAFWRTCK